jgi:hypothetical protein
MDNRSEKLDELNELNKSGLVSDSEFKTLLLEILKTKSKEETGSNSKLNELVANIREAGQFVIGIYYCIAFNFILNFVNDILSDVKVKYFYKKNLGYEIDLDKNFFSELILEMKNIDKIIKYLEYQNVIYYSIQSAIIILIMNFLWNLGKKLKETE